MRRHTSVRLNKTLIALQLATLVGLCGAAMGYLLIEPSINPPTTRADVAASLTSLPDLVRETVEAREAVERPLFEATRRPWVAPAMPQTVAPEPATQDDAPKLILSGIMLAPGGGKALLRQEGEVAGEWFSVGDDIAGWQLVKFAGDQVTLERESEQQTLTLYGHTPE
jgi:hypothetical protein